jgi:glutathione S-transferase
MKLRFSPTSPYVRKVLVVAHEVGVERLIDKVPTDPWDPAGDLSNDNPLGKVPALLCETGEVLYDSPVICEYLDSLHSGTRVFPAQGGARWQTLTLQALADGILDAAVLSLLEFRRPEALRSQDWIGVQKSAIERALNQLENEASGWDPRISIGQITVGCALGYLDFRFAEDGWRNSRPKLAEWYAVFSARPSMQATVPQG